MESFSIKEKMELINAKGQTLELSVLSPFFLDSAKGIESLENDIYTTRSYQSDGEMYISSTVQKRNIVFEGRIREDKENNRQRLIRFCIPQNEYVLRYTNGEIEMFLKCRVEKTPLISKEAIPTFSILLLCPKPYWYAKEIKTDIALWVGTFMFPLEIPQDTGIQMGYREPSLIVNVNNTSDNKAPLKLEFRALGSLKNPYIINVETREQIKIECNMVAGDVITVCTERGSEYVHLTRNNVTTNLLNNLTLDSNVQMHLDIGDNLLRYDAQENVNNLEVSIYFTPQYVGV